MVKHAAYLVSIAILLNGCTAHIAGTERPPLALAKEDIYYDTQLVVGPCDGPEEAVPLLPLVAATVISKGVDHIADAVKAAAAAETKTVTARRNIELRKVLAPCITVARGWFYRTRISLDSKFDVNLTSHFPFSSIAEIAPLRRAGLELAATPDFFFQGRIVNSTNQSAYSVLPVMASLDKPIASTPLRPSGARSLMIAFSFADAGHPIDLSKGGGATIVIGRIAPGNILRFSKIDCYASMTNQKLDEKLDICPGKDSVDSLVRSPFASDWFSVTLDSNITKPFTISALVSETRSESRFLSFVSDVLGAVKDTASKDLQSSFIPSTGLAATETANNAADIAQVKAIGDLKACVASPADAGVRTQARASMRTFIAAARAAGKRFEDDALANAIKTDGNDAIACQAAMNAATAT